VFHRETRLPVMVLPASIDNDVPGTDYSIGLDTAGNTALGAALIGLVHRLSIWLPIVSRPPGG